MGRDPEKKPPKAAPSNDNKSASPNAPKLGFQFVDSERIEFADGGVQYFNGDCIVNAANTDCTTDLPDDINKKLVEQKLQAAVDEYRAKMKQKDCGEGNAVLIPETKDNGLKYNIIHAIGPDYRGIAGKKDEMKKKDALLKQAYKESMEIAKSNGCRKVGFSLLPVKNYRGDVPLDHVLTIGITAIRDNLYPKADIYMIANSETDGEFDELLKVAKEVIQLIPVNI